MEPIKNVNKQNVLESVNEKKSWITPEIEVHDIVEMTKSGPFAPAAPLDQTFGYS